MGVVMSLREVDVKSKLSSGGGVFGIRTGSDLVAIERKDVLNFTR